MCREKAPRGGQTCRSAACSPHAACPRQAVLASAQLHVVPRVQEMPLARPDTFPPIRSQYQTSRKTAAHDDSIWAVAWPTDDKLITGSIDETVKVWRASEDGNAPLEVSSTMPGHFLGVVSVSASKDGHLSAVSSLDGRVKIWNLQEKVIQKTIDPGPVEAWTVDFHPQGSLLAAGSQSGHVNVFAVAPTGDPAADNKPEHSVELRGKFVLCVSYSPCGKILAAGAQDGVVGWLRARLRVPARSDGCTLLLHGSAYAQERTEARSWAYARCA